MKVTPDTREEVAQFIKGFKSRDEIEIECAGCGCAVLKTKNRIQAAAKNNKSLYCSSSCYHKQRSAINTVTKSCCNCGQLTTRQLNQLGITLNVFCSRSCSVSYNNKKHPKRKQGIKSPSYCVCGNVKHPDSIVCNKCSLSQRKKQATWVALSRTLLEYKKLGNFESYRYYARIRAHARRLAENVYKMEKKCKVCGYDFYVELCHIKPLASFPDHATGSNFNGRNNLVYLCPNHHKEQERGKIKVAPNGV